MTKTQIKKAIAFVSLVGILFTNSAFAENIGSITITDDNAVPIATITGPNWDGTFGTNSASGTVSGIQVKAIVKPTLSLTLSNTLIDLGDITGPQTKSINIEVGTNSPNGVTVKAKSQSGGLVSLESPTPYIINGDNYKYSSEVGGDSELSGSTYLGAKGISSAGQEETIYNSSAPEASTGTSDIVFSVTAQAPTNAPAGNYEDHITFTITAKF